MKIWDDLSKEDLDACFVIIEMQNQTEMKKVAADEEPTMKEAKKILAEATEAAVKVHPDLERFSPTKDSILFTKKLMNLFCNVRDPTTFYAEYPKESPHSSQYFGISQKHAALLMIKVFDAIVKSNEHQSYDEVQTAENITDREEEAFLLLTNWCHCSIVSNAVKIAFACTNSNIAENSFIYTEKLLDLNLASENSWFTNRKASAEVGSEFMDVIGEKSQKAKEQCGSYERLRYGKSERHFMDIFYPEKYSTETEIVIFFHGGYWHLGGAESYWFVAVPIVKTGKICVVMSRTLFPEVQIKEILNQDRIALTLISEKFKNTSGVTIFGHSSGGHECAMILSVSRNDEDKHLEEYLRAKLKRVVVLCGVVEVTQLLDTLLNETLKLSWQEALSLSPISYIKQLSINMKNYQCDLIFVNAENEGPCIQKGGVLYCDELKRGNITFKNVTLKGEDHFSMVQELDEGTSRFMKIVLGLDVTGSGNE